MRCRYKTSAYTNLPMTYHMWSEVETCAKDIQTLKDLKNQIQRVRQEYEMSTTSDRCDLHRVTKMVRMLKMIYWVEKYLSIDITSIVELHKHENYENMVALLMDRVDYFKFNKQTLKIEVCEHIINYEEKKIAYQKYVNLLYKILDEFNDFCRDFTIDGNTNDEYDKLMKFVEKYKVGDKDYNKETETRFFDVLPVDETLLSTSTIGNAEDFVFIQYENNVRHGVIIDDKLYDVYGSEVRDVDYFYDLKISWKHSLRGAVELAKEQSFDKFYESRIKSESIIYKMIDSNSKESRWFTTGVMMEKDGNVFFVSKKIFDSTHILTFAKTMNGVFLPNLVEIEIFDQRLNVSDVCNNAVSTPEAIRLSSNSDLGVTATRVSELVLKKIVEGLWN